MLRPRYDYQGRVRGLPYAIRPGDDLTVEIIAEHIDLSDGDNLKLSLALEKPQPIKSGVWAFTWGGDTAAIEARLVDSYSLGIALNRTNAIEAAGGVDVIGKDGRYSVTFRSNGARADFTVSHSTIGTLSNRALTLIAGGASNPETIELDLTCQVIAQTTTATDIAEATISIANVVTGTTGLAQHDRITISRLPDAGKFQIRTASDTGTAWLEANVSNYQITAALENIEPGDFLVTREVTGETIKIDLKRTAVGANQAPTVPDTFVGPTGVTMALDASEALRLINAAGIHLPASAMLTFIREGETQFSQLVQLSPVLMDHGQPV